MWNKGIVWPHVPLSTTRLNIIRSMCYQYPESQSPLPVSLQSNIYECTEWLQNNLAQYEAKGTPYMRNQCYWLPNFTPVCCIASRLRDTVHVEINTPNYQDTFKTCEINGTHINSICTCNSQISPLFALRPTVFETKDISRKFKEWFQIDLEH